ncbi:transporter substrate-binding domain-containing protein [Marinobacter halodurans]|uniref:Transporter substrate-binding domain-containing protein n=1 Tax=Marinobacter halodurans TaxID=2528979 RepID=A0ABY1ZHE0_9GAMM|nr:transporter substrate-binding domain-containing protein [Marinobacter halodurans]TBW52558.1 transporter substrate-binding domain-containing protein [Marinobacter halodurans]
MVAVRYLAVLALLVLTGPALAESVLDRPPDRTYDKVIESGYLRVGVYENFPPYSFVQDGQPAGVDVDVGRAIAKKLGVDFQVHWITPDETLQDDLRNNVWKGHYLAKRRIADVMMRVPYDTDYAYMTESTGEMVNEEVVMFGPYQKEQWQIAYDPNDLEAVQTVAVFQYNPIGVEIDSLPDFYLSSAFRGRMRNQTHHYHSIGEAFDAMVANEVSAIMGMRAEVDYLLATDPDHRFKLAENGFPGIAKQQWDVGMAVKSSHRQLKYAIEAAADKMVRDGEMKAIYEHYGLRYGLPAYYEEVLGQAEE